MSSSARSWGYRPHGPCLPLSPFRSPASRETPTVRSAAAGAGLPVRGIAPSSYKDTRNPPRKSYPASTKLLQITHKSVNRHGVATRSARGLVAGAVGGEAKALEDPAGGVVDRPVEASHELFLEQVELLRPGR